MGLRVSVENVGPLASHGLPKCFSGILTGDQCTSATREQLDDAVFECIAEHIVQRFLSARTRLDFGPEVANWSTRQWAESLLCRYTLTTEGTVVQVKVELGDLVDAVHLAFL